jgi:very-short-patch-repair endonuclease
MRRAHRPHVDLPDVFLGREALEQKVLTVDQLRGPLVRRVLQGVYRPAWVPLTHELACHAVQLVLPSGAAVTGRSQATLLGVPLADANDPVEVACHESACLPQRKGVVVRQQRAALELGPPVRGVTVTDVHRMAFNLAARHPLPQAVAHLDAVGRAGLVDNEALAAWLAERGDNNVVHVRTATQLMDSRAESIPESVSRVILVRAGFEVVPQFVVKHAGRSIARVDLALEEWKIAIEYDGAWHALREQLVKDRARVNALTAAGWLVVHVTSDMLAHPERLVAAVHAAIAQRGRGRTSTKTRG